MQAPEFLKRVQDYGDMRSKDEARQATRATLTTLSERLSGDELNDLFAQLPSEIVDLCPDAEARQIDVFGVDEFIQRVSARADVDNVTGQRYTRAVLSTIQEAASSGQLEDILTGLPREFNSLFSAQRHSGGR